MIHLIIGDGRGKTCSSVGLAVRAAGHNWNVVFAQFLKSDGSGELYILNMIPNIKTLIPSNDYGFLFQMSKEKRQKASEEYKNMIASIAGSSHDMIILDEVLHALCAGLLSKEDIESIIDKDCEIVMTGREAPKWLVDWADYISDIKKIKHPFDKGIMAREGVEY